MSIDTGGIDNGGGGLRRQQNQKVHWEGGRHQGRGSIGSSDGLVEGITELFYSI